MLDRKEKLKLKRFTIGTNLIKYTVGLPLLVGWSLIFIYKIIKQSISIYISVSLYPETLREKLEYYHQLLSGLVQLWSPNKLEFEKR